MSEATLHVTRNGKVIAHCRTSGSVLPLMDLALSFTRAKSYGTHRDRLYVYVPAHDLGLAFDRNKGVWDLDRRSQPSTKQIRYAGKPRRTPRRVPERGPTPVLAQDFHQALMTDPELHAFMELLRNGATVADLAATCPDVVDDLLAGATMRAERRAERLHRLETGTEELPRQEIRPVSALLGPWSSKDAS